MAAYALSGLQKRYRFEDVTYAVPDGGLRLIRPTKALPVRGCHLRCTGWRLTPYPAYKSATGSRVSLTLCRMAAYALSGLQKRYRVVVGRISVYAPSGIYPQSRFYPPSILYPETISRSRPANAPHSAITTDKSAQAISGRCQSPLASCTFPISGGPQAASR